MVFLFNVGCRNCLNGEERQAYFLQNGEESIYKKKTEFEVKTLIEKWRKADKHICRFCNSDNVEVVDVSIANYRLYDFDRMVRECHYKKNNAISDESIFEINLDKTNSQIKVKIGGEKTVNKDFLKACFQKILDTISQFPDETFKNHSNGNFLISLSGGFNFNKQIEEIQIQRCMSVGISRNEILKEVNLLEEKYGISFESKIEKNVPKKSWWRF